MKTFLFEEVKDLAVGANKLEFGATWDAKCSNVVGIVIVQNKYISVATGGWDQEWACLIGGDTSCGLKT